MSKSERLIPAIAIVVFSVLSLMAIETSETLTPDGSSPSERLSVALISMVSPDSNDRQILSNANTLDSR